MEVKSKMCATAQTDDDVLAVCLFENETIPAEFSEFLHALSKKQFIGKPGQVFSATTQGKASFKRLLLVGMGKEDEFVLDYARRAAGTAVRYSEAMKCASLSIMLPGVPGAKGFDQSDIAQAVAEGAVLSGYKFLEFKTKKDEFFDVEKVTLISGQDFSDAVKKGVALATAQNYVRNLDEFPANIMTPQKVAEAAKVLAKEKRLSVKVLEKKDLQKLGMNAFLGVNSGSALDPKLVVLEYNAGKKLPFYSIVGKGITFDSGGISLKPSKGMEEMKYDKTGALVVLGVFKAVAELGLPIRLLGLMPLTENMPSGSAQKPGDIVKAYNGKTIEVLNTDAEGRLILADALAYAAAQKPDAIIDLATLTGAILVALGRAGAGLFSNDDALSSAIEKAGLKTYERVWRFPLWPEYIELMKSDIADLKNISGEGEAGSITAAVFLKEFIGECKWAHLDIAGVDMISRPHPYLGKGASGIGVRLVVETLKNLGGK